jgi:hypothetical protein
MHIGYWWESQKERDHWEEQDVGGWTVLIRGRMLDRDQWRALVNTLMNLRVPYNAGKFLSSCTAGGFSRRAQLHE